MIKLMIIYAFSQSPKDQSSAHTSEEMQCSVHLTVIFHVTALRFFMYCTIYLPFNFYFSTLSTKNFQFQLIKLFPNRFLMLGSFQNRLSRNNVDSFHHYHKHQKFELLKFFFIR